MIWAEKLPIITVILFDYTTVIQIRGDFISFCYNFNTYFEYQHVFILYLRQCNKLMKNSSQRNKQMIIKWWILEFGLNL